MERGGADFLLLCTTTFHKVADQVAAAVDIPLLHLADVVAEACRAAGVTRVAFIGTTVAMSDGFFTDRMASHELEVLVPPSFGARAGSTRRSTRSWCTGTCSTGPGAGWSS